MPTMNLFLRGSLLLATFSIGAYAQATSGAILGTVTDKTGASISGVKVTVISEDRGISSSTDTNASGNYSKAQLAPGNYVVEFQAMGFQRLLQKGVTVSVDQATRVDAQLAVGEVKEQVEVSSAPPALVTDRAEVSTSLSEMQVQNLPILNRNLTSLQLLMPGAQYHLFQHASSENPQGGL